MNTPDTLAVHTHTATPLRYFIVFYRAMYQSGSKLGTISFTIEEYPCRKEIEELVAKDVPGFVQMAITNIIELSEKDFESWAT